jgi:hypothetical protein
MANIPSPYGENLFCYGENCLGGREGMTGIIFKEQRDLVV